MKRRDWAWARMKVDAEARCRVCKRTDRGLEAAHIIGRKYDPDDGVVQPDDIVPLCRACHVEYDAHRLSLLPYLTLVEQAAAVRLVGIERARNRTCGGVPQSGTVSD
jgi:hypothetical protein